MFENFNVLDIVLLAVLALLLIRSVFRGFIREILGLIGLIAAVLLSAIFYDPAAAAMAQLMGKSANPPSWLEPAAYAIILIAVILVFTLLGRTLSRIIRTGPFSGVDRLLGALTGLVKGVLVCYLLINLLLLLVPFGVPASMQQSWLSPKILQAGGYLISLVPDELTQSLRERAAKLKQDVVDKATQAPPSSAAPQPTPSGTSTTQRSQ